MIKLRSCLFGVAALVALGAARTSLGIAAEARDLRGGSVLYGTDVSALIQSSPDLAASFFGVPDEDCWTCWGGIAPCTETQHQDVVEENFKFFKGERHTGCVTSANPEHLCQEHSTCIDPQPEPISLDELVRVATKAVEDENFDTLRDLLAKSTHLAANTSRRAMQVTGCKGSLIAQIPIGDRLLAKVSSTQ